MSWPEFTAVQQISPKHLPKYYVQMMAKKSGFFSQPPCSLYFHSISMRLWNNQEWQPSTLSLWMMAGISRPHRISLCPSIPPVGESKNARFYPSHQPKVLGVSGKTCDKACLNSRSECVFSLQIMKYSKAQASATELVTARYLEQCFSFPFLSPCFSLSSPLRTKHKWNANEMP